MNRKFNPSSILSRALFATASLLASAVVVGSRRSAWPTTTTPIRHWRAHRVQSSPNGESLDSPAAWAGRRACSRLQAQNVGPLIQPGHGTVPGVDGSSGSGLSTPKRAGISA